MQLVSSTDPVLKQHAAEWDFTVENSQVGAEILEKQMVALMQQNNGVGLAANQVGLAYRVFTIKLSEREPFAMFNPRLVSYSTDTELGKEGCLSFPDLWLDVPRYKTITAEYLDKQGNECRIELTGLDGRIFLHELDHLNGVCFTDIVSPLKLAMAKKKQQKRKRNG
jgi:peptide deformylase